MKTVFYPLVVVLIVFISFSCSDSRDTIDESNDADARDTSALVGKYVPLVISNVISDVVLSVNDDGTFNGAFVYQDIQKSFSGSVYTDKTYEASFENFKISGLLDPSDADTGLKGSSFSINIVAGEQNETLHAVNVLQQKCDFTIAYKGGIYTSLFTKDVNGTPVDVKVKMTVNSTNKSFEFSVEDSQKTIVGNISDCGVFYGANSEYAIDGMLLNPAVSGEGEYGTLDNIYFLPNQSFGGSKFSFQEAK